MNKQISKVNHDNFPDRYGGAYEDPVPPVLCSPISLTNSVLQALQFNGCGTGDIGSTTFPYSATPAALTSSEYTSLNLPVADGSCNIATVKYTDAIDQALSLPGKVVVVRTFTITDVAERRPRPHNRSK